MKWWALGEPLLVVHQKRRRRRWAGPLGFECPPRGLGWGWGAKSSTGSQWARPGIEGAQNCIGHMPGWRGQKDTGGTRPKAQGPQASVHRRSLQTHRRVEVVTGPQRYIQHNTRPFAHGHSSVYTSSQPPRTRHPDNTRPRRLSAWSQMCARKHYPGTRRHSGWDPRPCTHRNRLGYTPGSPRPIHTAKQTHASTHNRIGHADACTCQTRTHSDPLRLSSPTHTHTHTHNRTGRTGPWVGARTVTGRISRAWARARARTHTHTHI